MVKLQEKWETERHAENPHEGACSKQVKSNFSSLIRRLLWCRGRKEAGFSGKSALLHPNNEIRTVQVLHVVVVKRETAEVPLSFLAGRCFADSTIHGIP
jgi:hypothetical protein